MLVFSSSLILKQNKLECIGAMTFGIMTLSIMTLGITRLSMKKFSITIA